MNFLAAARPAVTRSDNRRRKPRASTAANDNTWLRAKCQRALCFDSSTSPTTLSASFNCTTTPMAAKSKALLHGFERAGGRTACSSQHRLDRLRADFSEHPLQRRNHLAKEEACHAVAIMMSPSEKIE